MFATVFFLCVCVCVCDGACARTQILLIENALATFVPFEARRAYHQRPCCLTVFNQQPNSHTHTHIHTHLHTYIQRFAQKTKHFHYRSLCYFPRLQHATFSPAIFFRFLICVFSQFFAAMLLSTSFCMHFFQYFGIALAFADAF